MIRLVSLLALIAAMILSALTLLLVARLAARATAPAARSTRVGRRRGRPRDGGLVDAGLGMPPETVALHDDSATRGSVSGESTRQRRNHDAGLGVTLVTRD